eukprot:3807665-Prymnesium_polylepis.3
MRSIAERATARRRGKPSTAAAPALSFEEDILRDTAVRFRPQQIAAKVMHEGAHSLFHVERDLGGESCERVRRSESDLRLVDAHHKQAVRHPALEGHANSPYVVRYQHGDCTVSNGICTAGARMGKGEFKPRLKGQ